ncbi:MAG: helix-turn-helix domain-containing protein [Lewinellaceae bacterium]|nr:helix-turn-helix domain-containing protein [Lewinellaceae bacterium]
MGIFGCSTLLHCLERAAGNRTCDSIAQVVSKVGYDDASSFSRSFKQRFGKLPSEVLGAQAFTSTELNQSPTRVLAVRRTSKSDESRGMLSDLEVRRTCWASVREVAVGGVGSVGF